MTPLPEVDWTAAEIKRVRPEIMKQALDKALCLALARWEDDLHEWVRACNEGRAA
jgi:predicted transcriptional regulator